MTIDITKFNPQDKGHRKAMRTLAETHPAAILSMVDYIDWLEKELDRLLPKDSA